MDQNEVAERWLKAVEDLGKELDKKGLGDLFIELFLLGSQIPLLPGDLLKKANFHLRLQQIRKELNEREQRTFMVIKILKEKNLL